MNVNKFKKKKKILYNYQINQTNFLRASLDQLKYLEGREKSHFFMPRSCEVAHVVYGCVDHPVVMNDLMWPSQLDNILCISQKNVINTTNQLPLFLSSCYTHVHKLGNTGKVVFFFPVILHCSRRENTITHILYTPKIREFEIEYKFDIQTHSV